MQGRVIFGFVETLLSSSLGSEMDFGNVHFCYLNNLHE